MLTAEYEKGRRRGDTFFRALKNWGLYDYGEGVKLYRRYYTNKIK